MKRVMLFSFLVFSFAYSQAQYMLYGVTSEGGTYNKGTIFSYNPLTNVETMVFSFGGSDGNEPISRLLYASDSLLYGTTNLGGVLNRGSVFSYNWRTNTQQVIIYYDSTNGYENDGGNELIQAKNGFLYGTSWLGGTDGSGVIYRYDISQNKDTVLYNFVDSVSGGNAYMALWEDTTSGILYGVNERGGKFHGGVLHGFNILTNKDSVYASFKWLDTAAPWEPSSSLLHASNGLLYGTSQAGGTSDSGTLYSYNNATNTVTEVLKFGSLKGAYPNGDGLIQLSNGLIYGETFYGGTSNKGVLFSFDPSTNFENILMNFDGTNGSIPQCYLIQDPDNGLLYGTTVYGGSANIGVLFSYDITTLTYTKLIDFTGANGSYPEVGLTLVKDTSIETGVTKINGGVGVKVYPNPNNGEFTLSVTNNNQPSHIEIYNVLGEKVYVATLKQVQGDNFINLFSQPNGVYLYRVIGEQGSLLGEGKVVVER